MVYRSESLNKTEEIAGILVESLYAKNDGATVIAFYGDLGAGKTSLIQKIAKILGITEQITSPTYVIQKTYIALNKFESLTHIDAYRLENGDELMKIKFDEILKIPNSLVCVEWSENVEKVLPTDAKKVTCKFIDEETHSYEF